MQHHARALAHQQIFAEQITHHVFQADAAREKAVSTEIEAKALMLLRATQPADALLTLEDGDPNPMARKFEGRGHPAGAAPQDDDVWLRGQDRPRLPYSCQRAAPCRSAARA